LDTYYAQITHSMPYMNYAQITHSMPYMNYAQITHSMPYEPTHSKTRRGRPRTSDIIYIQKITGHQLSELIKLAQNL